MPMESSSVDHWRKFFLTAKSDILDVVENAIRVAISDCPNELLKRRDRIAELMFSCTKTEFAGRVGASVSIERQGEGDKREDRREVSGKSDTGISRTASGDINVKRSGIGVNRRANGDMNVSNDIVKRKGSKVDGRGTVGVEMNMNNVDISCGKRREIDRSRNVDDPKNLNNASDKLIVNNSSKGKRVDSINKDAQGEMQVKIGNVCRYEDIEALSDKIDEDNMILKEISWIKEILVNNKYESDSALLDSLWSLHYMGLTLDGLKATSIEEVVSPLCLHVSKEIRDIAQAVVKEWTAMKDEWIKSKELIADTPASVKPYASWDEGNPCPPLDDYCIPAQPTDLSEKFFEDLDDEGNPQKTGTYKNQEAYGVRLNKRAYNETTNSPDKHAQARSVASGARPKKDLQSLPGCQRGPTEAKSSHPAPRRREADIIRKQTSCTADSTPDRRQKLILGHRMDNASEAGPGGQELYEEKFEAAKRRIRECYEKAGEEKKQRTVQVLDIPDTPVRRLNRRDPRPRIGLKGSSRGTAKW